MKTWIEREVNCTIDFRKMFNESCAVVAIALAIVAVVAEIWG